MREHRTTNRVLLALLGLVLLGGGLLVLAGGADIYRRWNLDPPANWPMPTPSSVLIPRADQARWADQGWWWPTVIAALTVLMVLALVWLLSQAPPRARRQLPVADVPSQAVTIEDDVLGDALTTDLDRVHGVRQVQARVFGPPDHPQARIAVTLGPGSTPEHVLKEVRDDVERARQSAGWDELPAQVRLRVARHGPHRAE
jgi:hypothetical protein